MTLKSDTHDALAKTETLIEKARKNRSRKLSLADKGLSELPDSLFELSQLERLSLSGNQLTELPESIGQLKGLEALDVSSNRLVSLPESIGELTALRNLNLADNQLREVPDSVGALIALRSLFIYNNNLRRLPYGIGRCIALHTLHIAGNHLDSLPDSIGDLKSLKTLGVSHNELREVPASIGSLKSLSRLNLNYNPLTELPASVTSLESLTSLYVESTQIRELPKAICKLISLRVLSVSDNHLTGLPVAIGSLSSLKGLYLQNNRLTDLPQGLRTLASLSDLFLHGNPGLELPPEVLGPMHGDRDGNNKPANPADILDYYFRTKAGRRPLNEAKLVLVGRGGVGKTSVVNRLARDRFDPNEKKTEGIKITDWEFGLRDGEQARLNIWDFGGQEIMHATHQFFLTERSLYLLVVSGREGGEDADAEYWLRLIESFGGDSPVIVVLNKIKDHPFDLNRGALKQKYPRIRGFIKTDCKAGTGCDELRNTVMTETDRLEHLRDPFPAAWFAIKDKLASTKRNYLSFEEYRRLCAKLGEKDESAQEALAGYLNSLGIALNYKDDPRLKDMHILNPHWVTGGVYRILNSPTLESQKGEIRLDDLSRILGKTKYPASMHRFLLDLMKKFELCFNFPEDDSCFLIPELLDKQQPAEAEQFQPEDCLNFEYHYPVLPEGLLPRFIVRSHGLTAESTRWRTGAILKFEGCEALVKADVETKKVCIHIRAGRPESQRRLLAVIRSDFERIHRDIKNLRPVETIPLPGFPSASVDYRELIVLEEKGVKAFPKVVGDQVAEVNVQALLGGVDLDGARRAMAKESPNDFTGAKGREQRPIAVFISYSHKDEALRNKLEAHLKILQRLGLIAAWHDRKIAPGENWKDQIDDNLQNSQMILLLVSSDFIASDYCYGLEMTRAMERYQAGEAIVVPIIVRDVNWKSGPFAKLQALPKDGKAVTSWTNRDSAWRNVSEGIERLAAKLRTQ